MTEKLDPRTEDELLALAKHFEEQMKELCGDLMDLDERLRLKQEKRRLAAIQRSRLFQNPPE